MKNWQIYQMDMQLGSIFKVVSLTKEWSFMADYYALYVWQFKPQLIYSKQ